MMENRLRKDDWTNDTLTTLIQGMREEGLVFKEITLQYRTKTKNVFINATGRESMKASENYFSRVEEQLIRTYNIIFKRFINFAQCQVDMTLQVNEHGEFDFENMQMAMHMDIPSSRNAEEALRRPLRNFLPFLENVTYLEATGHKFELKALHCSLELSEEDFAIVLEDPSIIHPKARLDWLSFGSLLFMKAKDSYSFNQKIPCFSGELLWDNKDVTIKHTIKRLEK